MVSEGPWAAKPSKSSHSALLLAFLGIIILVGERGGGGLQEVPVLDYALESCSRGCEYNLSVLFGLSCLAAKPSKIDKGTQIPRPTSFAPARKRSVDKLEAEFHILQQVSKHDECRSSAEAVSAHDAAADRPRQAGHAAPHDQRISGAVKKAQCIRRTGRRARNRYAPLPLIFIAVSSWPRRHA